MPGVCAVCVWCVDGAVDCPVEVPEWFMGLCGFLGDLPCWMPRGAVIVREQRVRRSHFIKTMGKARRPITASPDLAHPRGIRSARCAGTGARHWRWPLTAAALTEANATPKDPESTTRHIPHLAGGSGNKPAGL